MCGRYYRTFDKQKVAEALRVQANGDPLVYVPAYNIAPTTTQPVLRLERDTLERDGNEAYSLRLGLRYVRGLRATVAAEIERIRAMRPFGSIEELARRVPSLSQADLTTLAETGALNSLGDRTHRRDALWQVERAAREAGPLLSGLDRDEEQTSPLAAMNPEERMVADYAGTV